MWKVVVIFLLLAFLRETMPKRIRNMYVANNPFKDGSAFCCNGMTIKLSDKTKGYRCCGRGLYNPDIEHCCNGINRLKQNIHGDRTNPTSKCCGNVTYDINKQSCSMEYISSTKRVQKIINKVEITRPATCAGKVFNFPNDVCCGGNIIKHSNKMVECCGGKILDEKKEVCCRNGASGVDTVFPRKPLELDKCCNGDLYNSAEEMCCNGSVVGKTTAGVTFQCCGDAAYDPKKEVCCNAKYNSSVLPKVVTKTGPDTNECCGNVPHQNGIGICCENLAGKAVYHAKAAKGTDCCGLNTFVKSESNECCGKSEVFNPTTQTCCYWEKGSRYKVHEGKGLTCCRAEAYKKEGQDCCNGVVAARPKGMSVCCTVQLDN